MLDYVLDDIERIEVTRGPGATLWGANAVNGVVNIITRHTRDTQGTFAGLSVGNEDPAIAEVRHGGQWQATGWRVYGKFARRDNQQLSTGASAEDTRRRGWNLLSNAVKFTPAGTCSSPFATATGMS